MQYVITKVSRGEGEAPRVSSLLSQTLSHDRRLTCNNGSRASELPSELLVVVVDPSTSDSRVAVERSDARVGEESSQDRADEASNGVKSETIDSVVNLEEDLDSGSVVGGDGGDESDTESSGRTDETGSGGDSGVR